MFFLSSSVITIQRNSIIRLLVNLNRSSQVQRKCPISSKVVSYRQSNETLMFEYFYISSKNTYLLAYCEQQRTKTKPEEKIAIQIKSCCVSPLPLPYKGLTVQ